MSETIKLYPGLCFGNEENYNVPAVAASIRVASHGTMGVQVRDGKVYVTDTTAVE